MNKAAFIPSNPIYRPELNVTVNIGHVTENSIKAKLVVPIAESLGIGTHIVRISIDGKQPLWIRAKSTTEHLEIQLPSDGAGERILRELSQGDELSISGNHDELCVQHQLKDRKHPIRFLQSRKNQN